MKLGVIFPQTEIGTDPVAIRDYAQAAEALGYDHIIAYDHVLGANVASRPGWKPPYTHKDSFYEPFVLFAYLAGLTNRIGLVPGVIVLPQRQTALVAKQASVVDVLSGGRLRLGVGIGWNPVEYEALGENFKNRGRRSEEQIEVLRALFSRELVNFKGRWHTITDAGINPLPTQRPLPIWLGGGVDAVLQRVARLGDGWFPLVDPGDAFRRLFAQLCDHAAEVERDPTTIGIEARVVIRNRRPDDWKKAVSQWKDLGATHLAVNTMNAGLSSPSAHIEAIGKFKELAAEV